MFSEEKEFFKIVVILIGLFLIMPSIYVVYGEKQTIDMGKGYVSLDIPPTLQNQRSVLNQDNATMIWMEPTTDTMITLVSRHPPFSLPLSVVGPMLAESLSESTTILENQTLVFGHNNFGIKMILEGDMERSLFYITEKDRMVYAIGFKAPIENYGKMINLAQPIIDSFGVVSQGPSMSQTI